MMNLPPPDPRSSRIGLDEVIGIIVAFTTIGTILVVSLGQKDKVFNFNRLLNPSPTDRATKTTTEAVPVVPLPAVTPKAAISPTPEAIAPTPSPSPDTLLPIAPVAPATPTTPPVTQKSVPTTPPVVLVPSAPKPDVLTEKSPATTVQPVKFSDVPENLWARPYIDALATQGILNGFRDGTFKPNSSITRAEFATLLQKAFQQEPKSKGSNFQDVSAKFWASPAIQEAVKTGFMRGYPNNVFRPNQKIPRVQVL
ncbi:MAG TPA: S-layer protein, partial [Cyanobacteria bacterium UBA8553]|nr:S-layer protein [Cyanobacteria bacterium UBA8553]